MAMLLLACLTGMAQTSEKTDTLEGGAADSVFSLQPFIGYLSYQSALEGMPDYAVAKAMLSKLRQDYEQELKRVEDEFNQKYEDFLDGQKEFPRTILLKRQNELQDLMQKNVEFRKQGLQELQQAEQEAMAPLRLKLNTAIASVAKRLRLSLVVNTDSDACPYIEPDTSIDIQKQVAALLGR